MTWHEQPCGLHLMRELYAECPACAVVLDAVRAVPDTRTGCERAQQRHWQRKRAAGIERGKGSDVWQGYADDGVTRARARKRRVA